MKRKIFKAVIALIMVAALLAGCRTATPVSTESADTSSEAPVISTEARRVAPAPAEVVPDGQNSGPITVPLENDSYYIMISPAYDKAQAKQYINEMPAIRSLVDGIGDDSSLVTFGSHKPSDSALSALKQEISKLTADGHTVSLIMADLSTSSGVSYCSSTAMSTLSTVKAIYCGALVESNPDSVRENGRYLREAIEFSNNLAYENLRFIYGTEAMIKWCEEAGVDTGFCDESYPYNYTARDMFKLWTRLYAFLNGDKDKYNFAAYYADSACSATKKQLGGRCPVQTKAGWECGMGETLNYDPYADIPEEYTDGDHENGECGLNDTGIVYTESGPYIFVIYTDYPFGVFMDYTTPNPLYDLTEALYNVQQSIE